MLIGAGADPKVCETSLNPSAIHRLGQRAKAMVEAAREEVRALVGAPKSAHVIFCSGATEANNHIFTLAARGARARASTGVGKQIVVTSFEHPAVLEPAQELARLGSSLAIIPVDTSGVLDQAAFEKALGTDTQIVSVMCANNETGLRFPVASLARTVKEKAPQAIFHTDAAQAIGKMPVNFAELGVDALSLSGHKFGAPAGIGALILAESVAAYPMIRGGTQESRLRGGTENVLGIVAIGVAAREARTSLTERIESMRSGAALVWQEISSGVPDALLRGSIDAGLPNTLSVTFPGCNADDLVVALDIAGVCVSAGAACSSGKPDPSHVLRAMGLTGAEARSTIRISLEPFMDRETVLRGADAIVKSVALMREQRCAHAV